MSKKAAEIKLGNVVYLMDEEHADWEE